MSYQKLTPTLIVDGDLEPTIRYYHEILGFELDAAAPEQPPHSWIRMRAGAVEIMFQTRQSFMEERQWQDIFGGLPIGATTVFYLEVKGIHELYERVKDRVDLVFELDTHPYGMWEFTLRDPNGYILAISEPIT